MKKLLIILISIFFISCSSDDDCYQCEQLLEPIAESYGTYLKSTNEITIKYRFISPFRPEPKQNEIGEFGETNGYFYRIYKEGEITVDGVRTLSFPITDVEKNESFVEGDGYYSRDIFLEIRLISGNESDLEAFWFAKSGNSYLVQTNNRNVNALNVLEENKCRWINDDVRWLSGTIPFQGRINFNEWIESY